eukprot:g15644.t1
MVAASDTTSTAARGRGRSASTPRQPLSSVGDNNTASADTSSKRRSASTRPARSRSYSTKNGKGKAYVTSALEDSDHPDDSGSEFEPSSSDDDSCTLDPNTETPPSPDLLAPAPHAKRQKTARTVRLPARLGDGNSLLNFAPRLPGFSGAAAKSPSQDEESSRAPQPRRPLGAARVPAAPTSSGARPGTTSSAREGAATAAASSEARPTSARPPTLNGGYAAGSARRFGVGMGTATGLGGASSRGHSTVRPTQQRAGHIGTGRERGIPVGSGARPAIVTDASTAEYLHRLVKPATPLVKAALCGMLMSEAAPSMFSAINPGTGSNGPSEPEKRLRKINGVINRIMVPYSYGFMCDAKREFSGGQLPTAKNNPFMAVASMVYPKALSGAKGWERK